MSAEREALELDREALGKAVGYLIEAKSWTDSGGDCAACISDALTILAAIIDRLSAAPVPASEANRGEADEPAVPCCHPSSTGVDHVPMDSAKVWRCDACGWLHRTIPDPDKPGISMSVPAPRAEREALERIAEWAEDWLKGRESHPVDVVGGIAIAARDALATPAPAEPREGEELCDCPDSHRPHASRCRRCDEWESGCSCDDPQWYLCPLPHAAPARADEPTVHDLIVQLRDALGLFSGAMPISPKEAWEEALAHVAEPREGEVLLDGKRWRVVNWQGYPHRRRLVGGRGDHASCRFLVPTDAPEEGP